MALKYNTIERRYHGGFGTFGDDTGTMVQNPAHAAWVSSQPDNTMVLDDNGNMVNNAIYQAWLDSEPPLTIPVPDGYIAQQVSGVDSSGNPTTIYVAQPKPLPPRVPWVPSILPISDESKQAIIARCKSLGIVSVIPIPLAPIGSPDYWDTSGFIQGQDSNGVLWYIAPDGSAENTLTAAALDYFGNPPAPPVWTEGLIISYSNPIQSVVGELSGQFSPDFTPANDTTGGMLGADYPLNAGKMYMPQADSPNTLAECLGGATHDPDLPGFWIPNNITPLSPSYAYYAGGFIFVRWSIRTRQYTKAVTDSAGHNYRVQTYYAFGGMYDPTYVSAGINGSPCITRKIRPTFAEAYYGYAVATLNEFKAANPKPTPDPNQFNYFFFSQFTWWQPLLLMNIPIIYPPVHEHNNFWRQVASFCLQIVSMVIMIVVAIYAAPLAPAVAGIEGAVDVGAEATDVALEAGTITTELSMTPAVLADTGGELVGDVGVEAGSEAVGEVGAEAVDVGASVGETVGEGSGSLTEGITDTSIATSEAGLPVDVGANVGETTGSLTEGVTTESVQASEASLPAGVVDGTPPVDTSLLSDEDAQAIKTMVQQIAKPIEMTLAEPSSSVSVPVVHAATTTSAATATPTVTQALVTAVAPETIAPTETAVSPLTTPAIVNQVSSQTGMTNNEIYLWLGLALILMLSDGE